MTYLLFAGVVVGGYLLWVYAPYYLDHYDAKSKCEKALYSTWRYHDEAKTAATLRRELASVRHLVVVDEDGERKKVPAIDPAEEDLQVEIDRSVDPPVLRANVAYQRTIYFPLIKKERTQWFSLECKVTLDEVLWNQ
jgi:hypothetical protein